MLEGLRATGFIPPRACLSQYGGGWLLNGSTWPYASPLSRADFSGLPSQHPPAVLYTTPLPLPHPSPRLLLLIPCPQSDLSSWILSICLIISPLAMPPCPSVGSVLNSKGSSEGPKGTSTGLPDYLPRKPLSLPFSTLHCQVHNLEQFKNFTHQL